MLKKSLRKTMAGYYALWLAFVTITGVDMAAKKPPESKLDALTLARAAGLDKAVKQFPEDVAVAAQSAANARGAMPALDDVAAEPWPPMRMRSAP